MKQNHFSSKINLETFAGGAFAEKFNEALMQVAENIQNPNTDAAAKRGITIGIKFQPNKTRQIVSTTITVTTKLAATEAIDTQMVMGIDMRTGQVEIAEYNGQIKGQMSIADFIAQTEESKSEPAMEAIQRAAEIAAGRPIDLRNRVVERGDLPDGGLAPGRDYDPETGEILRPDSPESDKKFVKIGSRAAN